MSAAAENLPLPDYAYIPGQTQRHKENAFDWIKEFAPAVTSDLTTAENIVWYYGLRLIREGYYWEAHEVLETVWLNAPPSSREKQLVQGIIHITNAALKLQMGRPKAADKLAAHAAACINEVFAANPDAPLMRLDRQQLGSLASEAGVQGLPFNI